MQARGFLNYRLKHCWPKVIYCIYEPNELEREIKKKLVGQTGGPTKILWGPWPTQSPVRIATAFIVLKYFMRFTTRFLQHNRHQELHIRARCFYFMEALLCAACVKWNEGKESLHSGISFSGDVEIVDW